MSTTMAVRRPRRSLVVLVGGGQPHCARGLVTSLAEAGVEACYLGREDDAGRIAAAVVDGGADAVELCLSHGGGGVAVLRKLLRELVELGRRDVSIVVHRLG
jgi:methylmalonyl-CoA mutase cobalamin-binding subunit